MSIFDEMGLLCLIIHNGPNKEIVGRTKLQKIVYFCNYLGWDINDYKLHYYGPFSFILTDTIDVAERANLIELVVNNNNCTYRLTAEGKTFLEQFVDEITDNKVNDTIKFVEYFSKWSKEELDLVSTIDYVQNTSPKISQDLINKIKCIKNNFSLDDIELSYEKWLNIDKMLNKQKIIISNY